MLTVTALRKVYVGGDGQPIEVLTDVNLEVHRGEFVAIVGESGAGKSTLLHLLGALDGPTSGEVRLDGQSYRESTPTELAAIRNQKIGFVFQFHHLLRDFTARENVAMPLLIAGIPEADAQRRAEELLTTMGLGPRLTHRPTQLSGGEQQRVALARALATDPLVVLADEPSGNLDHQNSERLHDLLGGMARDLETALVIVTHNRLLAARADRVLSLEEGRLIPVPGVEAMR